MESTDDKVKQVPVKGISLEVPDHDLIGKRTLRLTILDENGTLRQIRFVSREGEFGLLVDNGQFIFATSEPAQLQLHATANE